MDLIGKSEPTMEHFPGFMGLYNLMEYFKGVVSICTPGCLGKMP